MYVAQHSFIKGIARRKRVLSLLKPVMVSLLSIITLFLTTNLGLAQVGMVQSFQKISTTAGGFLGNVDPNSRWGEGLTFIGDVDGDNVKDIAVGAPWDNDGGGDRGAVWVLFLHPNGTVKSHQKISATTGGFTGTLDDGDIFGWSVEGVGDLDNDGIPDLAVGAPQDNDGGFFKGAIWILHLHPNGTVKTHQKISDGSSEFTGALGDNAFFGASIAALGDLDNDGIPDLAVGAPGDSDGGVERGAVWVLFLNAGGTVKSFQKINGASGNFTGTLDDHDYFGFSLAAVGDLDSDGILDLAVGSPFDEHGGVQTGALWVLFIESTGMVKFHQKISSQAGDFTGYLDDGDFFGFSVAAVGDLDGDDIPDMAVGAPEDDDGGPEKGAIWVLFMENNGMVKFHQKISEETGHFTETINDGDSLGVSVAGGGDLNGDSIPDLAVGALVPSDEGAVWIFHMNGSND